MKKNDTKVKVLGAVAIAAGAAMIGRIIYDFKKIRQLTKEDDDLVEPEAEAPVAAEPVQTEAPAEAPAAEPVENAEAPAAAEEAPAAEKAE